MFGGPAFSAQKFQKLISSVTGRGSDGVKKALVGINKGGLFSQGAKVADAKKIMGQLRAKGLIKNSGEAADTFRRAERAVAAAARVHESEIRRDRLAEFRQERAANADSVVRQQAHSVSVSDKTVTNHTVSINQKIDRSVSDGGPVAAKVSASALTQSQARATAGPMASKLIDIPLD